MSRLRTRIAAGAAIVGLGGLAGIALSAGQHQPSATVAAKPVIRTKVIRRTIHVTKHAKPRHPAAGPGGGVASNQSGSPGTSYGSATTGSSSSGSAPSYSSSSTPVTTSTSGSASVPSSSTGSGASPVVTHTSGASAGSGGGSSAPVTTATSGAGGSAGGGEESDGGEHSGGHDD